ncbi:aminotransferase class I/II-fold pyridoxal phosphate-dependent enzyme [Echinimonas agarilytica]|uniref:8-amino-7-oxononanoate synthase n=1 Tax=Echinimonas agarilytica TaxID=1215918 RepID=A0AA41W7Z9_9GAMM|nr:8-amino-7-oxononanoate synthase [Echinimonas agarilytica]MCM2680630.1 8-amino-7-oxononanoate synthase [Echinimonas agarilytica]
MSAFHRRIRWANDTKRQSNNWRDIHANDRGQGRWLVRGQQRWLNFASNDYLGLAAHPSVISAFSGAVEKYGAGSGGSTLITGHHTLHANLQSQLAEMTHCEDVLLFGSGFSANQGVLTSLMQQDDLIVQDKLNHASLIDGGLSSAAHNVRFQHNQIDSARRQLARAANTKLLVTESVFSMDGDQAPLAELAHLCAEQKALFMVDDAHGLGVIGEQGAGASSIIAPHKIDVYMATFGKAVGVGGAMVGCDRDVADYLRQFCRHYIYTTAMPPAQAAAISAALTCMATEPEHWQNLHHNIQLFKSLAVDSGIDLLPSDSAIQPVLIGASEKVIRISEQLRQSGIACGAIRSPTVKQGQERLRFTLSACHEETDIRQCVSAIASTLEQYA